MSMAWLCLPVYTALLVGCFQTAVTENDVTPRLSFPYSKSYNFSTTRYLCHLLLHHKILEKLSAKLSEMLNCHIVDTN